MLYRPTTLACTIASVFTLSTANAEPTLAKTDRMEVIVVTASGFEQKLVDAPASISVITHEELSTRPYTTLLDAVRDLEGVDIGETRDKTGQGSISMRGMGSDYTLILVDGKRQNNHGDIYPNNFGGNQFGHIPPLDAVDRIEVIRGPASTLYGADALGGVINIITRKVTDKWVGSVSHSRTLQTDDNFGEDITSEFNVMGPLIPGVLGMSLRGSAYNRLSSMPQYATVEYPNGEARERSLGFGAGGKTVDNKNEVLGGRLSWTPSPNQSVWFDIETSIQQYDNTPVINENGDKEYPVGTVDNIDSIWAAGNFCKGAVGTREDACIINGGEWARRTNPRAGYSAAQQFTRDTWSLSHDGSWAFGNSFVSLSYVDTQNHGRTLPFTTTERELLLAMFDATGVYADMSLEDRKALAETTFLPREKRVMASNQYTLDAKLDMPFNLAGQHILVSGIQIIRGELEDGVFGMEDGTPGEIQEHNMWSVFVEDTWDSSDSFSITAGLRHDDHQVFGSQLSPRLYGVYTLNEQWTIKGGISTGYKTPKTTQLYDGVVGFGGQGTSPQFGNSALQAETSVSSEIAAYWNHQNGHNFNLTIFKNEFDDKIDSQPCGTITGVECSSTGEYAELGYTNSSKTVNIDKVSIQGAELASRWEINDSIAARINYTYTDSEQKSGAEKGQPLGNSSKHMANLSLNWAATDALNLFLTSEMRTKRYRSWDTNTDAALYYEGYHVLHMGASFKASESVTFNLRINNLLDHDFTTYNIAFTACNDTATSCIYDSNNTNGYSASFIDDFNNKDKARNFWAGVNVTF
ncbi:TonB-dependent receptor domain-containing protein [Paraglaciecola hydrolytica]|uniref:TonB-dependent receptor n=1 Tax=Paraglaciecola hydrolytica TaxID=1799789 RepID=A0A148KN34_9ALTE|nr:TonB-dependent receptor [Paraglaciecola hydrolytica]KXI27700.1 TonB-dependent receptor [Paraglaciecola hydrolytica]